MSQNEKEAHARELGLTLEEFDALITAANNAYDVIKKHGPFYGKEELQEPTFRITAHPIKLPKGEREKIELLGTDLLFLAKALQSLPESYKQKLGDNSIDFRIPPTWRIDSILSENGVLRINEIEGKDGASALMMAEQFAYGLQHPNESTAAKLYKTLVSMCDPRNEKDAIAIALLHVDLATNPLIPNTRRFIQFLEHHAKGSLKISLYDGAEVKEGKIKPDWEKFNGIINENNISHYELIGLGAKEEQIISSGNFSAIANKGVYALLYDAQLKNFWEKTLGHERLKRLQDMLIPAHFVETVADIELARGQGKVVKVSWAGTNTMLVNKSRGVAMPEGDIEHSTKERWDFLKSLVPQGIRMIAQDYVRPTKIKAFLRKKGTNLEPVDWYNRVCAKYVCEGNPQISTPTVSMTALEVTLGPDVIPAGRACAFTAGVFTEQ